MLNVDYALIVIIIVVVVICVKFGYMMNLRCNVTANAQASCAAAGRSAMKMNLYCYLCKYVPEYRNDMYTLFLNPWFIFRRSYLWYIKKINSKISIIFKVISRYSFFFFGVFID